TTILRRRVLPVPDDRRPPADLRPDRLAAGTVLPSGASPRLDARRGGRLPGGPPDRRDPAARRPRMAARRTRRAAGGGAGVHPVGGPAARHHRARWRRRADPARTAPARTAGRDTLPS